MAYAYAVGLHLGLRLQWPGNSLRQTQSTDTQGVVVLLQPHVRLPFKNS